jgi:putative ABC transport system permease protein
MELLRDILLGVRSQPWRTALAFVAIVLGSLALGVMTAVLGGLAAKSAQMLREFGGQVIVLAPAENASAGPAALTEQTAAVLAQNFPEALVAAARRYVAPAQGGAAPVAIVATDAHLARVRDWRLLAGRFLDERDVQQRERSAVLSAGLAQAWGARVGELVTLGGAPFRVVGVVASGGSALAGATDNPVITGSERVVFVPLTTAPTWLAQRVEPGAELDAIFVRLPETLPFAEGRAHVAQLIGDPALTHAAVAWITPETILRGVRRMQRALDLGIGSIALLSLALGGITLMSLLVGNVRERVTEIGLRRALGATRRDVAALFVLEGCLLTTLAALVGAGVAQWVLRVLSGVPEIPLALDGWLWLAPLGVALGVGLLASYVPARLAAGIAPADALRAE